MLLNRPNKHTMNNVYKLLNQLESKIPLSETLDEKISQANVAWHIEHSLLVIDSIRKFIVDSNPKDYKWSFNFTRSLVLLIKTFPRGRAKAPKSVRPVTQLTNSNLRTHLEATRTSISVLETLPKNSYFKHPIFGKLNSKQTIIFFEIHTNHHLKIIKDIIKQ